MLCGFPKSLTGFLITVGNYAYYAHPRPRLHIMIVVLRLRFTGGPPLSLPLAAGLPPLKSIGGVYSRRYALVVNPSSTAQRGRYSPRPVAVGCKVEKNTGVRAGVFFLTGGFHAAPTGNPPQMGVLCPPVFSVYQGAPRTSPPADDSFTPDPHTVSFSRFYPPPRATFGRTGRREGG
jgi:hypothetical protein